MRFLGFVGVSVSVDELAAPGVHSNTIQELNLRGRYVRVFVRADASSVGGVHNDLLLQNRISILDPYLYYHVEDIRYVRINGVKWSVTSVEKRNRRVLLSLGGVWHG